jgi:molybdate transport system substrate-binding protein
MRRLSRFGVLALGGALAVVIGADSAGPVEPLVIAVSPSVHDAVEALARAFEAAHPGVQVRLSVHGGLELRRMIAAVHHDGRHTVERGVIHLVAPGSDELLDRLERNAYVLPETRRAYMLTRLVLVVPEALADAPESFEALAASGMRVAVADPRETELGLRTRRLLERLGLAAPLRNRLDVATDARAVLDHVLNGQADAGVVFSHDAVRARERVRVAAAAPAAADPPIWHSMAMDRFCPDRRLGREFLDFTQTEPARAALRLVGYEPAPTP